MLRLPKSLRLSGEDYKINSDFRVGIKLMQIFEDPKLSSDEVLFILVSCLYQDEIPVDLMAEAAERGLWFLDGGPDEPAPGGAGKRMFSWKQDLRFIVSAVDKTIGFSTRGKEYLHWWDFLNAFNEIGESVFATIIMQRSIKSKGKQTDADREWWSDNLEIAELRKEHSAAEQNVIDKFKEQLEGGNG